MFGLSLLSLLLALPAQVTRQDLEPFVRQLVAPALEHEGVPGISVAVAIDGELVLASGFGWADEIRGIPMGAETVFPIGSLGRSLVAAAALREVERKSMRLESTLGELVPEISEPLHAIALRQLLDGTSGLPSSSALFQGLAARKPAGALTWPQFLTELAALPMQAEPGAGFSADSSSWLLLPLVIERASKRSFNDCLAQEICVPLGLRETQVRTELAGAVGHAADCLAVEQGTTLELWTGLEPSAARAHLFSTARDLVRWQSALFQHALLTEASAHILLDSARSQDGTALGANACFELGELGGAPMWRHVGGLAGWRGALAWHEQGRLAVCVLANCEGAQVAQLEEEIARYVLGLPPLHPLDLELVSGESAALCGVYMLGTLRVRIHEESGSLWYESATQEPVRLRNQGLRRYLAAGGEFWLRFKPESANAASFEVHSKGTLSVALRTDG
ncbi:MAG: beta-lactamase family protein [Planctomycetes bacterium]|nr:beta-lactamase family protein [Planctomycetota bacterium]